MKKCLVSLVLCLAMVLNLLPINVFNNGVGDLFLTAMAAESDFDFDSSTGKC